VEGRAGQQQGAWIEAVVQLHPPASVTALSVHSSWGVLAAGTAHGLAVYDITRHKAVHTRCTLNPNGNNISYYFTGIYKYSIQYQMCVWRLKL
jgi:hypothetical protein